MDFKDTSIEGLMKRLLAIQEGRYPTPGHLTNIKKEIHKRVGIGTVIIWKNEKKVK